MVSHPPSHASRPKNRGGRKDARARPAPIRAPIARAAPLTPSPLPPPPFQANPYLLVYNTALAAGWAYVLYLTFATVAAGGWTKEVLQVRGARIEKLRRNGRPSPPPPQGLL
jgi:hypothetical protein